MLAHCSPSSRKKQANHQGREIMMFWQYIVFGLVQGLTEFLPVSSSGHLLLLNQLFGFSGDFVFFALLLHLATLLAVVIVMKKDVLYLIKNPFSPLGKQLLLATIPTVVIVLLFKSWIESTLSGALLPFCFMFTGVLLIVSTMFTRRKPRKDLKTSSALIMGIAQGVAVIPGISRSGATICAGLISGESRDHAASFSFLMSIPIILASMAYELLFATQTLALNTSQVLGSILAFVIALVVGVFAIRSMLKLVKQSKLWVFSIYLFALAGISLLLL